MKGVDVPVLVKNPVNPDLALWIGALERLLGQGVENIGAIQQQALNDLIEQHLQAAELTKFEQLKISDAEVDQEIAGMAREVAP